MTPFELAALLVTLAALFGLVNHFLLGLPSTIGLTVIALLVSLVILGADAIVGISLDDTIRSSLLEVHFADTLLEAMLGFLLFAGALHVDLERLRSERWTVALIASVGVLLSTAVIATGFWALTGAPFAICLVFGALITPTDPVAVLGLLKEVSLPKTLETKIAGESLFNDGVAYVVFLITVAIAFPESHAAPESADGAGLTVTEGLELFVVEAGGGALFGFVAGWAVFQVMRRMDDYALEVLLTLALVMGGYALATALHLSGPITVVVAGLLIGHAGMQFGMSDVTREHVDAFWRIVDEILNAVLFLLIGLEIFALEFQRQALWLGLACIPLAVGARFLAVSSAIYTMRLGRTFAPGVIPVLTWGGLRGGISVAMALSLPDSDWTASILTATYVVVIFSIIVQGLTMKAVVRRAVPEDKAVDDAGQVV